MRRHVSFAGAAFERTVAHGGARPILADRVLDEGDCASCGFVDLVIVPAGADIGVHTHERDNEELYVIVSGAGAMHLDGAEFPVTAGDVIVNRPGGTHGLVNRGPDPLRLVVIEVPVPEGGR